MDRVKARGAGGASAVVVASGRRPYPSPLAVALDARTGALVVVLGGMLAFQSSGALDATKVVYLSLAALAFAVAGLQVVVGLRRFQPAAVPWLATAVAFGVVLAISLPVSLAHGTSAVAWLRDASSYLLFAAVPLLALPLGERASRRWLTALFVLAGTLAAVSFCVSWVGRRHIAELPVTHLLLPTVALAACLVGVATALALAGDRRRAAWTALAGIALGLLFITGTRSILLFLGVPAGLAVLAGWRQWRLSFAVVAAEVAIAFALLAGTNAGISLAQSQPGPSPSPTPAATASATATGTAGASPSVTAKPVVTPSPVPPAPTPTPRNNLSERIGGVGSLLAQPGSDLSLQDRFRQSQKAFDTFLADPLLGVGPGHVYTWQDSQNYMHSDPFMDTPLIYLSRFGLLGLVPLGLLAWSFVSLLLRLRRRARLEYLTFAGVAGVFVVIGVLTPPIEDKGMSFGLLLGLAVALGAVDGRRREAGGLIR